MTTPAYAFSPVDDLPEQEALPDPFLGPDGRRVRSLEDWPEQREYLKAMLAHYMYGRMPPRPGPEQVTVDRTLSNQVFDGRGIEERYTLTITNSGRSVDLPIWLYRPDGDRRCPTIVKNCSVLFDIDSVPEQRRLTVEYDLWAAREAVERGYLLCKFERVQLAPDRPDSRREGVYPLYPGYDWGAIAVWAWGHHVVLDVLDRLGLADMDRTVCTGHSRGGQAAIAAGIFDERIGVVVPCTGGYGSCGTLRIRDPEGVRGTIDYIDRVIRRSAPHWHSPRYHEFSGRQNRLPFDAHMLVALVAPRPLLNTNATEDQWNNALSIEAGMRAGGMVYDWMGIGDRCRLHWRPGKHGQMEADWRALLDFADEHFFGKTGESRFNRWLHADFTPSVPWQPPSREDRR